MQLAEKQCVPCTGDVEPLKGPEIRDLLGELGDDWALNERGHLERTYTFPDFTQAMGFASEIGLIADLEGHHPDLHVAWGRCTVEIWTHAIAGLSESDFILAAKTQRAWNGRA